MNEAIKLAIEKGGWLSGKLYGGDYPYAPYGIANLEVLYGRIFMNRITKTGLIGRRFQYWTTQEAILDPLFWQSLGKALGWNKRVCKGCGSIDKPVKGEYHDICPRCNRGNEDRIELCLYQAHHYFDLVLTNGDTEKFWQDLLNPNRE